MSHEGVQLWQGLSRCGRTNHFERVHGSQSAQVPKDAQQRKCKAVHDMHQNKEEIEMA